MRKKEILIRLCSFPTITISIKISRYPLLSRDRQYYHAARLYSNSFPRKQLHLRPAAIRHGEATINLNCTAALFLCGVMIPHLKPLKNIIAVFYNFLRGRIVVRQNDTPLRFRSTFLDFLNATYLFARAVDEEEELVFRKRTLTLDRDDEPET